MRVVGLEVKDFKGIRLVSLKPDGTLIKIQGENGEGKTSLIDAVMAPIRGKANLPAKAVREGAEKAVITLDLGDYVVRQTIKPDGRVNLTITTPDGMRPQKPQALLDSLAGDISFDPSAFAMLEGAAQIEMLQKLGGLDFDVLDAEIRLAMGERRDVSRDLKQAQGALASLPGPHEAPETAPDTALLMAEIEVARKHNAGLAVISERCTQAQKNIDDFLSKRDLIDSQLDALEARVQAMKEDRAEVVSQRVRASEVLAEAQEEFGQFETRDTTDLEEQLRTAGDVTELVNQNAARKVHASMVDRMEIDVASYTKEIERLRASRKKQIEDSPIPVDGLSFDAEVGVTLNGVPFKQCSTTERLRTSVGLTMASNPTLKVMLLRDCSLLSPKNRELIVELAEEGGYQVWMELVGDDGEGGVVIEDGRVKS